MPPSREPHTRKSFRLLTLGGAALVDSTGVVVAEQRRRLALLVLVASGRERGMSRDRLVASLSPESPTDSARHALHQLLYYLRQQVGDDAFLGTDPLRLNRDVIEFDVADFEAALDAGALADAVALYRGPFLDGFHLGDSTEFEEWAAGERARLAARHVDALGGLADAAAARGNHRAACEWWRRLATADPLSDRAALGLVRSLAAGGDRSGAVRHARMHEGLVRAEIGGELEPELAALVSELQRVDRRAEPREAAAIPPVGESAPAPGLATIAAPPRRRLLAAGLLGAGLMVVLAAMLGERPIDRNLLAIAPFDVLDPSLQLWREGLGDILSRSLDGAGPLRTVSPTVALRRWEGRADRASAEAFGRRTGAGLVVFGAVVPKGRDSVTLRAGVLDAGSGGQREVEVSGESARIGALADSLGFRILQVLGQSRAIGSVRQVSMGSRSLPALRAFLQGEQFYRRGSWDSALVRYEQAIAADSTFALALVRMRAVLIWNPPTAGAYLPAEEYARRSTLYNYGLSPRESLLIVSDSFYFAARAATDPDAYVGFNFRALAAIEEAVRRYPGDPEAWYLLGETRLHTPFPIGTPPDETFEPFNRAIALDSGFAPAYEHMAELAIQLGHPELARRYAAAYLSLYPDAGRTLHFRLALLALDPTRSDAPDAAGLVDSASVGDIYRAAFDLLDFFTDSAEAQVRLLRRIGDRHRSAPGDAGWVNDSVMWPQYLAAALAYRGHLREAYQTDRRLLLDPAASRWSPVMDPFVDLALLGAVPDSLAERVFARALEPTAPWNTEFGSTPRHLRGIPWWLAHGDTASLRRFAARAAEETTRPHPAVVVLRARLLGATATAYLALVRGDSAGAVAQLEAIPDTLCLAGDCFHLNLTLARLLSARGDDRRAGALLERWRWATHGGPWFVLATLERGRVAERLGEREKAIQSYHFVTEAWRRPDPELQPYVSEAREALARLARTE